ncbi:MAG TPA: flagellar export chaperone FliS [Bryobacteraceae bacterium]|jgi:flagellar protein FliS|nr:flagellar export chaperone FliS [Bryobacteraceae bacterium]
MYTSAEDSYLETEVMTAEPVRLIELLYQGVLKSVAEAEYALATGDILARGKAITKAQLILGELSGSLDHSVGGQLSGELAKLYEYMVYRLSCAHQQQTAEPLQEVGNLVRTLLEGWQGVRAAESPVGAGFQSDASQESYRGVELSYEDAEYSPLTCVG